MMRRLLLTLILPLALLTGCGDPTSAAEACSDHGGGVRAQSFEQDPQEREDGGGEARCNDGTEIESEDATSLNDGNWTDED